MLSLKSLFEQYDSLINQRRDMRSIHLPLAGSPAVILGITAAYLYIVLIYGPRYMLNRNPFHLRHITTTYNLFQLIANSVIFIKMSCSVLLRYDSFSFRCQLIDFSRSTTAMEEVYCSYAYFLLKLLDLADTAFFVLRKKQSHVSFLHVYHHSLMVITSYCGLAFVPGGHVLMLGLWNTLVHAIMYFYYFLTAISPKKNIWWKKYLTQLQLVQFIHLAFHFGRPLVTGNCEFPLFWLGYGFFQAIFVLVLFLNFYIKAYNGNLKPE